MNLLCLLLIYKEPLCAEALLYGDELSTSSDRFFMSLVLFLKKYEPEALTESVPVALNASLLPIL